MIRYENEQNMRSEIQEENKLDLSDNVSNIQIVKYNNANHSN